MGRPFVVGPRVPPDRVRILQKAFAEAMVDPTVVAQAERAGLHPLFISPEELKQIVVSAYATPRPAVERLKAAYNR